MTRVAYVNGSYVPFGAAAVHIEDRGYQFADAVYEVVAVRKGQLIDLEPHFVRLKRSLEQLSIPSPMSDAALTVVLREMIRQNRLYDGILYFQISRGVAPREHGFPAQIIYPALVVTAKRLDFEKIKLKQQKGIKVKSVVENRWARPDIKTVNLLGNVLAKEEAKASGADDAWFVDREGFITEGTANNAWIIKGDTLITRELSHSILGGITRKLLFTMIKSQGLKLQERRFSLEEVYGADEAFITSTTNFVMPVVMIDGNKIANGKPGDIAKKLAQKFWDHLDKS